MQEHEHMVSVLRPRDPRTRARDACSTSTWCKSTSTWCLFYDRVVQEHERMMQEHEHVVSPLRARGRDPACSWLCVPCTRFHLSRTVWNSATNVQVCRPAILVADVLVTAQSCLTVCVGVTVTLVDGAGAVLGAVVAAAEDVAVAKLVDVAHAESMIVGRDACNTKLRFEVAIDVT